MDAAASAGMEEKEGDGKGERDAEGALAWYLTEQRMPDAPGRRERREEERAGGPRRARKGVELARNSEREEGSPWSRERDQREAEKNFLEGKDGEGKG